MSDKRKGATARDPAAPAFAKVRVGKRAISEREAAHAVLDAGRVGHVGFVAEGRPMVIPMIYARIGERLYLHGAKATRIIKGVDDSAPICLSVTLLDGLVIARSAFHHSMNYRSVVAHGQARHVTDAREKEDALIALTDHMLPGRWGEVRPMSEKERRSTGVLALDIEHLTMKMRDGPPIDDEEDYALPVWAGVVHLAETVTAVDDDPRLGAGIEQPASLEGLQETPGAETAPNRST